MISGLQGQTRRKAVILAALMPMFLLISFLGLRLLYRDAVHVYCLKDTMLINASVSPLAKQPSSSGWRSLAVAQNTLGDISTALCFAQRSIMEGKNPFDTSGPAIQISSEFRDDDSVAIMPSILLSLRALAAATTDTRNPAQLLVSAMSLHGYLPIQWLYSPYETSLAHFASMDAINSAIRYRSAALTDECVTLSHGQVAWGLPILTEQASPRPCVKAAALSGADSSGQLAYTLLRNGGFEWPASPASAIPGFENLVYQGDPTGGSLATIGARTVLLLQNGKDVRNKGLSTKQLLLEPGSDYLLGAEIGAMGGRPYFGIRCWLGGDTIWTWYVVQGAVTPELGEVMVYGSARVPDDARECYVLLLNAESESTVWFDNVFLVPLPKGVHANR